MEWNCLLVCFIFEHVLLCHCSVVFLSTIKVYSRMPAARITQQPRNAIKHVCLWQTPCVIVAGKLAHQKMLTLAAAHELPDMCCLCTTCEAQIVNQQRNMGHLRPPNVSRKLTSCEKMFHFWAGFMKMKSDEPSHVGRRQLLFTHSTPPLDLS